MILYVDKAGRLYWGEPENRGSRLGLGIKNKSFQWLIRAGLFVVLLGWPSGSRADNCHVKQIIYRSGERVHFAQTATSNVGYGPGKALPTEKVSIEIIFNVPMLFETFHPYSVYIRTVSSGSLLNGQYTKGNTRDDDGNPHSVIIIIEEDLAQEASYELIVQGWDLVPSVNATVANVQTELPDSAMRHSLQWVFTTVEVPDRPPPATNTFQDSGTFYIP